MTKNYRTEEEINTVATTEPTVWDDLEADLFTMIMDFREEGEEKLLEILTNQEWDYASIIENAWPSVTEGEVWCQLPNSNIKIFAETFGLKDYEKVKKEIENKGFKTKSSYTSWNWPEANFLFICGVKIDKEAKTTYIYLAIF